MEGFAPQMEQRLSAERKAEIVSGFARRTILVIGDLMVDEYLLGAARRISQEGPVMVVEVLSEERKPGGAANVANNLRALGAAVAMVGVVGDDAIGNGLRRDLAAWSVLTDGILTDPARPTTLKTRIVAQSQQVLRVDREQTHSVAHDLTDRMIAYVASKLPEYDAVLVSDYRKGVLTESLARTLCELARVAGKPLITNPKPSSAHWLAGADLLSLNQLEAEEVAGASLPAEGEALRRFGERLVGDLDLKSLMITRGSRGLCLWLADGSYFQVPAHVVEVADIAGAGDTTIGTMALALACGAKPEEAAELANLAGACVVRKFGVATITTEELLHAL